MSLGGSEGSSNQQSTQGFSDLPPEIQNAFKDLATQAQGYLPGNNSNTPGMFTPLAQTAGETQAINNINKGFTPTADSLQQSINMQTNPYDQSVIDTINRQAQGQGSVLNQQLNAAGQFGSNRAMLGANDIDLSRLQQIGTFKQGEYNTALQNGLTTIPQQQQQDAQNQLAAGGFQRTLAGQTAQAPVSSLAAISQILGVLPTNSGTSSGSSSQFGFNGSLGFSDKSVKENIEPMGQENGYPIYAFNYIWGGPRMIGVMADEVEQLMPEAVTIVNGLKAVDYGKIGVKFRHA